MATALVSAVSGRKVRRDVAMTGELTLTGRVLPIGGLKEKVLGAVRAGINEIILPIDNEADLDDLPDEVRENVVFHLAETLDDVIEVALGEDGRSKPGARKAAEKKSAERKASERKASERKATRKRATGKSSAGTNSEKGKPAGGKAGK
jgi:ATP-dependent Lon protease